MGVYFISAFLGAIDQQDSAEVALVGNETDVEGHTNNNQVEHLPTYVWIPMVLGAVILLTSILGCCGAKHYNRMFLALYVIFVGLIFLFQLVVAAILFADISILSHGLDIEDHRASELSEVFASSASAVSLSFLIVLFVELLVMAAACCFRGQITGDEVETSYQKDLESQVEEERERKKLQFEMQSRKVAFGEKRRWFDN
eukprot:CAMPEP_0181314140 /NCGR_PEP_ID=MMETSP1101-20121128/14649_1 /TAXON_ID=46948 /ORGANISM="Rhodomonas abbreviata, Strain Caron Lab Isolate" /LENGTH=199 /DNA_ID=CAMNT_0023421193 /DNA_START=266 /DNA_END=865 /DNA_ORIENTATION=+